MISTVWAMQNLEVPNTNLFQGRTCMMCTFHISLLRAYHLLRADTFNVSQSFLLQQAAWLYERQLSQVRAQMRKVGASRQSGTPSPSPGSASASMIGGHAMKRAGSGGKSHPLAIYGDIGNDDTCRIESTFKAINAR
jgi:hypothetical protein